MALSGYGLRQGRSWVTIGLIRSYGMGMGCFMMDSYSLSSSNEQKDDRQTKFEPEGRYGAWQTCNRALHDQSSV